MKEAGNLEATSTVARSREGKRITREEGSRSNLGVGRDVGCWKECEGESRGEDGQISR